MARNLTEKQEKFLDALFGEAKGNAAQARKIAGYESTNTQEIVQALKEEIYERTKALIASSGPKAAFSVLDILENPTDLGNKDKLAAAKDLLDRAGFKPQDKVEVSATNPLFILPEKND